MRLVEEAKQALNGESSAPKLGQCFSLRRAKRLHGDRSLEALSRDYALVLETPDPKTGVLVLGDTLKPAADVTWTGDR